MAQGFFGNFGSALLRLPWLGKIIVAGLAGAVGVFGQDIARSPGDWYAKIAPAQIYLRVAREGTDGWNSPRPRASNSTG